MTVQELPPPLYNMLLVEARKQGKGSMRESSVGSVIVWAESAQGHDFWYKVHIANSITELPPPYNTESINSQS